ncbi:hypothetical protein PRIPAC_84454 [Pristionchus pacificus]|uniref:Uncharacterized protein n=1 Tax=Pristionchus pacificus TaxID=54126 RepID=A0A2A6C577_PRIPA|nr:hypothetical protein PRIPAC_84454 [Pristionchus pacificus]|eukprot:PDM73171.1 hypothetical protein PRIPAC_43267 [Pristionchus pacificus]
MEDRDSTVLHPPPNKLHQTTPERIEECKIELGPDGYGIDDHFSRLPDLCIINIFKHLERCEMKTLSMVNSRMFPFANEREFDSIKWERNYLLVYEDVNRYSFTIEGCEQKHDCDYKISRNEDGHFTETRECREHVQILHCSIPLNTPLKGTHHTKTLRTKTVPSSTSVMDYFFAALTELLRHRGLFYVTLRDISITKADNVEEGRIILAEFVRNIDAVGLYYGQNIINEYFIRTLAGGKVKDLSSDDPIDFGDMCRISVEKLEYFFHPDRSILPFLIGYEILEIPSLVLNHNWIADLAMMCIEFYGKKRTEKNVVWLKFSVDHLIRSEEMRNRINDVEFEYTEENGNHFIKKRSDGMKVKIWTEGYPVEGSIVHSIILRVFDENVVKMH